MANHKSALKRFRQSEKRRIRNRAVKSALHTQLKKAHREMAQQTAKPGVGEVRNAQSAIAVACRKGIMHKKTASRRISRLMKAAAKIA